MSTAEIVLISVIASVAFLIIVVGLLWRLLGALKGLFDLGRKTARLNPWLRKDSFPKSD